MDGKRAYLMARKGDETILPTRKIEIREFDIRAIRRIDKFIEVDFRVSCGKGTYIRSLARDFGKALDSGSYLSSLRRTRIGEFRIEDAMSIEDFVKLISLAQDEKL